MNCALERNRREARKYGKVETDKMLEIKVIKLAETNFSHPPTVFVRTKVYFGFVWTFEKFNALTARGFRHIPKIDKCIDLLEHALIFSILDTNRSFWWVEIVDADRDKVVFTSHNGLYRVYCKPFRLCNVPGSFQWTMDVIASQVKVQLASVYMGDIMTFQTLQTSTSNMFPLYCCCCTE